MDKKLIQRRFSSRLHTYNDYAQVQKDICKRMAAIVAEKASSKILKGIEIGAGTGFLTSHIVELFPDTQWYINDIVYESHNYIDSIIRGKDDISFIFGDGENIDMPENLDMVVSASTVQWFDSLPLFIEKIYPKITDQGIVAISTFGPENFSEIAVSGNVHEIEYFSASQIQKVFENRGFDTLYVSEYTHTLLFDTPMDVLRHIKLTGVNSVKTVTWTKGEMRNFCQKYIENFSTSDGKVTLTYCPVIIVAKKSLLK